MKLKELKKKYEKGEVPRRVDAAPIIYTCFGEKINRPNWHKRVYGSGGKRR